MMVNGYCRGMNGKGVLTSRVWVFGLRDVLALDADFNGESASSKVSRQCRRYHDNTLEEIVVRKVQLL